MLANKYLDTTCEFKTDKSTITITKVTGTQIEAGSSFWVTLYGLVNSKLAAATDTFSFEVKTEKGGQVMYQNKGLTVTNDCDYPCLTCDPANPSKCLTCETTSEFALFLNGQCLSNCPSNYYA